MKKMMNRGAVLIIALIMLAVVTFIIIAYLAFSQRERASVNMSLIHTETRFILDMGTAVSQSIVSQKIQEHENYQLIVSANEDGAGQKLPAYDRGTLTSLMKNARPPVYYDTNEDDQYDEFRYSLDLNRDGIHTIHRPSDNIGDPHWIGVLEDPGMPHGPENHFVGRYAYMIVPASKTLDFNHIHNWVNNPGNEGYGRYWGGSYGELNFAGTLAALGPDWKYNYNHAPAQPSTGTAFTDAVQLLSHRFNAEKIYDVFDFYHPHRGTLKPLDETKAGHPGLTARLETAGGHSFYDLAGSISTVTQPPPSGRLNLNGFINPRSLVVNNGININSGLITLNAPHGMTNGARVNLFSDTAVMPAISSDSKFPGGRRVSHYDRFYVKTDPDNKQVVTLYHNFFFDEDAENPSDQFAFSNPVKFTSLNNVPNWQSVNPTTGESSAFARNDIVTGIFKDEDGNPTGKTLLALRNHRAPPNLASYSLTNNVLITTSGIAHWKVLSSMPSTAFSLDRTGEMYETILARLLKSSPGTTNEMVRMESDGIHASFNIQVDPMKQTGGVDPNDPFAGLNFPFFNFGSKTADVEFNPEVRRLMQVAANMCDIYTPGPYPSVFRPVFGLTETNRIIIQQFVHEPDESFLSHYPARSEPRKLKNNFDRLGRLDLKSGGVPRSLPLAIGAKKKWGGQLPPMINEISLIPHLKYDYENDLILPMLRMHIETRNPSSLPGNLELHIIRAESDTYQQDSGGTREGLVFRPPNKTQDRAGRRIDFVHEMNIKNQTPWVVPLGNGNGYPSNGFDAPLRYTTRSGGIGGLATLPVSDRGDWDLSGYLTLEIALVQPGALGKRGKLIDHVNLKLYYRSDDGINIPSWNPNTKYIVGDEVIHNTTKKRYYCRSANTATIDDQVKNESGQVTGLDESKWASAEWKPGTAYHNGEILIYKDGGKTKLFKVIASHSSGNRIEQDIGSRLFLYGGNSAENSYQVNDPLVNGQEMDYLDYFNGETWINSSGQVTQDWPKNHDFVAGGPIISHNIGRLNQAFLAWSNNSNTLEHSFKDPGVFNEGSWEFPQVSTDSSTGKTRGLGNVGELGFVHRGTPWQTVYLKSDGLEKYRELISGNPDRVDMFWKEWIITRGRRGEVDGGGLRSGGGIRHNGAYKEGQLASTPLDNTDTTFKGWSKTIPLNDHHLIEEFAALPSEQYISPEEAMRGLLSINQENRAAWAAALCGVQVVRNASEKKYPDAKEHIHPSDTKLGKIVMGINNHRKATRKMQVGTGTMPYARVTDILGAPELTSGSPFLDIVNNPTEWHFEAIPRQTLSLLRVEETPYFVAYVFSQALRPKDRERVGNEWLITNYEVVGEAAARTIFRLEGANEWAEFRENGASNLINAILAGGANVFLGGGAAAVQSKPKSPRVVIESYTPITAR